MTDQTLPVKKSGRPSSSVLKRLGREGQLAPETWPTRETECWFGPALISFQGTITRTPRACLIEMFQEPLHSSHRLQPVCKRDGCINPHHYRIATIRKQDGTPMEPLPVLAFGQVILDNEEARAAQSWTELLVDVASLIRPILEREPDLSDADLETRLLFEYSQEDIREARTTEI